MIGTALVDTDVVSFMVKQDTRAGLYRAHLDGGLLAVSFQTVAELEQWVRLRSWGDRRKNELYQLLRSFVILHSEQAICSIWGQIRAQAKTRGRPIDTADAWIAATALCYSLPLITHNRADFRHVDGLTLISLA